MSAQKFIFYGLIAAVAIFKLTEGHQKCQTPSKDNGYCIPVKACEPFTKLFGKDLLTPDEFETIEKSSCPKINDIDMICCPLDSLNEITTAQSVSSTTQSDSITNLSLHPNLKLIPVEECGNTAFNKINKISGGQSTEIFDFPWMAILRGFSNGNQPSIVCDGTLISSRYVLTAAHCLRTTQGEMKIHSVVLGEHNTDTNPDCYPEDNDNCADEIQEILVERLIPHSNYNITQNINDIGLIRLQWDVQFSFSVSPICLPYADKFQIKDSNNFFVTGWGGTETGSMSNVLLKATLYITSTTECSTIYDRHYFGRLKINENFLCAHGVIGDICTGNSGGPAVSITQTDIGPRMFQYGVLMSGGVRNCGENHNVPGAYTRVTSYMGWILDNIGE